MPLLVVVCHFLCVNLQYNRVLLHVEIQYITSFWYQLGVIGCNCYVCVCVCMYVSTCMYDKILNFESWAKLGQQQWLVCEPLGIHLEPINKQCC